MALLRHGVVALVRLTLAAFVAAVCLGCLMSQKSSSRENGLIEPTATTTREQDKTGRTAQAQASDPLIPVERENKQSPAPPTPVERKDKQAPEPQIPVEREKKQAVAPSSSTGGPRAWEEDLKVKEIAFGLARKLQNVAKIKICLDPKADEWWIILYEDTGSNYSLHQHIWHRGQDNLEPFLVSKTVPKSQLEASLGSSHSEMACEVLDPPAKESPKAGSED
jgi:hypothetical protein